MFYENNWESLNSRPVPEWFADAKFGIFIHWGLYSVPAYAQRGNYAEWYGYTCSADHFNNAAEKKIHDYHQKVYGSHVKYEDFVKDFTAHRFNADEWAALFQKSGAKYINFVSKHHDGFCMYDTDHAWNWNSVDVGPHRDFCMELKEALEKTDVKFGVYHSVYEWFHPTYLKNPEEYATTHLLPMLKELVEKYKPWTLFTDGEWEHESDVWHSTEFLQWLYNESTVKDTIVPNDRWGKETRGVYGGNFTSEYGHVNGEKEAEDLLDGGRVFEECRGIGCSFGINKEEQVEDYMSARELIELFVDLVSKGGNLLLNIGPDADGHIPVLMQERLLQMGDWLKVNGEAIYGSRAYPAKKDDDCKYTENNGNVYAFTYHFPFESLVLDSIDYNQNYDVSLLGSDAKIETANDNGKLKLLIPPLNPDKTDCKYVYTFRLKK